jgi:hypothetical protein
MALKNRYNPSSFAFSIEHLTIKVICIGESVNFNINAGQFANNYKSTHLSCTLSEIIDAIFKETFATNNITSFEKINANVQSIAWTDYYNYRQYSELNKLLLIINTQLPNNDILLVYHRNSGSPVLCEIYVSKEKANNKLSILEDRIKALENKITILEQDNIRLNGIISLPTYINELIKEEERLRNELTYSGDNELIDINKYYSKIQYFMSEQRKRDDIMKERLKQQILDEMLIPSAPPSD